MSGDFPVESLFAAKFHMSAFRVKLASCSSPQSFCVGRETFSFSTVFHTSMDSYGEVNVILASVTCIRGPQKGGEALPRCLAWPPSS